MTNFKRLVKLLNIMLDERQVEKIREMSTGDDKSLPLVFSALSDPGRLQVFKMLIENQDICVSDIANILGISVPGACRQLTILETSGLVEKVRKGQSTCFRVLEDNQMTKSVIRILEKVAP
mgnify:CR=1 FL=1